MAVQPQTPYQEFIANGTTSRFDLSFLCKKKEHLIIKLDDVVIDADWSFIDDGVVFTTPPSTGVKVSVQRRTPNRRNTNYKSYDNSFTPGPVNDDFDALWMRLQEEEVEKTFLNQLINMNYEDLDEKGKQIRLDLIEQLTEKSNQITQDINSKTLQLDQKIQTNVSQLNNKIIQQGVSQQQLQNYYLFLLTEMANLSGGKNWLASLIADASGRNQQEINDNQKVVNLRSVTPYDFGAYGDGISHKLSERYSTLAQAQKIYPHAISLDDEIDWCAIQKFANLYIVSESNRYISFNMSGHWVVNRTCDFTIKNGTKYAGAYKSIAGDSYLTVRSDFIGDTVVALNGRGSIFTGFNYIKGGNFVDYGVVFSDRSQQNSISNAIAFGQGGFKFYVDNVRIRGVQFEGTSMFNYVEFIRGYDCGTVVDVTAVTITNRVVSTLTSRSDIVLSADITLPDLTKVNVFVTRGRDIGKVTSYDPVTRTLEVRNAFMDTSTAAPIKLYYGGLVGIRGSDSAGTKLGVCSGVYCPHVIENTAMYTVEVTEIVSEFSQAAIYDGGLVGGLKISTAYFEGDTWQYISDNASAALYGFTNIGKTTAFNMDKWTTILYSKNANENANSDFGGLRGVQITEKDIVHRYEKPAYNENNSFTFIDMNSPFEVFNRQFNIGTIQFSTINKQYNKLFGYDLKKVVVHGASNDAIPSGNITFKPPSGWTINGVNSDVVFNNFTGAAEFYVKLRPATNDINIVCTSLRTIRLSNQNLIPATYASANDLPSDTKYWFSEATTVSNLPMPTSGVQTKGNIETYYSYAKSGEFYNKTQVVYYPSLFEKWERVFSSALGAYAAWKLISYEIKKGTTVQRPLNPQIGMKYYDTTLLASGKPIEFNGVNWIDATGVTV